MKRKVKRQGRQPKGRKNANIPSYTPLSADAALEFVFKSNERKYCLDELVYFDGVGLYTLCVVEGHCKIECSVGKKVRFRHFLLIQDMKAEYKKMLSEKLKDMFPYGEQGASNGIVRAKDKLDALTDKNRKSAPMAAEKRVDHAANKRFQDAMRSQLTVRSQVACDDMRGGRSPGHVGDLK